MSIMNDLTVTRQTLGEWLRGDIHFIVPHYQRKYCWAKDNCERLFKDLLKVADVPGSTHFFGTITLSPLCDGHFYIVDGQQRLTTLWLFANVMGQALKQLNGDLPASDRLAKRLTFEDPHDQKTWRHLLLDRFCDDESLNQEMINNASWLSKEVEGKKDILRRAQTEHGLLDRMLLVHVVIPSNLAPQRIFERMNSVKLDIKPMDLIKNFLLMQCQQGKEELDVYHNWENEFQNRELMFRILVESLICSDVDGPDLYNRFRQLFESNRFGLECGRVPTLLAQFRVWFEAFKCAEAVFEKVTGGHGLPWRYRTLLMRTAMVFSPDQADARRRNRVLAIVAEHILGRIASERLRCDKLHPNRWDRNRCHNCLKSLNEGEPTADRFEEVIAQNFAPIARDELERGFEGLIDLKDETRPKRNWSVLGLGEDTAEFNAKQMTDRLEMRFNERRYMIGV